MSRPPRRKPRAAVRSSWAAKLTWMTAWVECTVVSITRNQAAIRPGPTAHRSNPGCPARNRAQGLENALICGAPIISGGRVRVRDRLGGLLKYYYRQAA